MNGFINFRSKRFDAMMRRHGMAFRKRGALIDLLTDSRHWCDRHSENFAQIDRLAYQNYLLELNEQRRPS